MSCGFAGCYNMLLLGLWLVVFCWRLRLLVALWVSCLFQDCGFYEWYLVLVVFWFSVGNLRLFVVYMLVSLLC